jgi:cytoskeletal protein RodZ
VRIRTWTIIGVGAAAAILIGATIVNQLPGTATTAADGPATTSASPRPSAAPAPRRTPATAEPGEPSPGATAPPQSKRFTTEVIPGQDGSATLPTSTAPPEPIANPLPETASATGKLAAGYPDTVLPPAPQSSIATSAVTAQGSHLQVSLTASSSLSVVDLHEYYRTALARFGMYDSAAPAAEGATAYTFRRGTDSVTLTASTSGKKTSYILYGAFTAKS